MRLFYLVFAVFFISCTTIPPECRDGKYGAARPMHCPEIRRAPANPKECNSVGGIAVMRDGEYKGCANREDIRRILDPWNL
jgi:hypothetical protein